MKPIIFVIFLLCLVAACRTTKSTKTEGHKTVDSSTVLLIKNTDVRKKDSTGKDKTAATSKTLTDSTYERETTIRETYSDEFDFLGPDSLPDSRHIKGGKRPGLTSRTITVKERGVLRRDDNSTANAEHKTKLKTVDSIVAVDSTGHSVSVSESSTTATTAKVAPFIKWWYWLLLIILIILYYLNKRFKLWQTFKMLLR